MTDIDAQTQKVLELIDTRLTQAAASMPGRAVPPLETDGFAAGGRQTPEYMKWPKIVTGFRIDADKFPSGEWIDDREVSGAVEAMARQMGATVALARHNGWKDELQWATIPWCRAQASDDVTAKGDPQFVTFLASWRWNLPEEFVETKVQSGTLH
jgi:hypothetical protein